MEIISQHPEAHLPADNDRVLATVFSKYPVSWEELRKQRLVYFYYRCFPPIRQDSSFPTVSSDYLLVRSEVKAVPIAYEDFLPLSPAGILQSNLQSGSRKAVRMAVSHKFRDEKASGHAPGMKVVDIERWSADRCSADRCSADRCRRSKPSELRRDVESTEMFSFNVRKYPCVLTVAMLKACCNFAVGHKYPNFR